MGLYKRPDSEIYWMSYIDARGKRIRESTKTTDPALARRLLDDKRGRIARGEVILPRVDRITYDEARDDLVAYYETYGSRDLGEAEARLKHLDTFFSGAKLATIGQPEATAYARQRQGEEAAAGPSTANWRR